MAEKEIQIPSQDLLLEGLLGECPGGEGVVVTHPHPLYGGEMQNNVVEAVVQAYQEQGFTTLRFNFRGVGRSSGSHDNGMGEQEDVLAALRCLEGLGKTSVDLAGYSFGAWVNAKGLPRFDAAGRFIMISPPVNFLDFSFLKACDKIRLVIAGSHDDIGPPAMIQEMLPSWNPSARFHVIEGADHFYWGREGKLVSVLSRFLEEQRSMA